VAERLELEPLAEVGRGAAGREAECANQAEPNLNVWRSSRQLRDALRESERDYKGLRSGNLTPEQVSVLQVPFRLTDKDVDRAGGTVQWPEALQADRFNELTKKVDAMVADGVNSDKSAKQFFSELGELNTMANQAVVSKEMKSSDYAKARRFITGLANEVRATEYGDVLFAEQ